MNITRIYLLVAAQVALTALDTYLISRISLIGRIGIAIVHREYRLLRSGWKTFFLLLGVQLLVIAILAFIEKRYSGKVLSAAGYMLLAMAVAGLLITYLDFLHTYTHRLLKERFHLGFYLFWLGWAGTCVAFLAVRRPSPHQQSDVPPPAESKDRSGF